MITEYSLLPHNLVRPQKIRWSFPIGDDVFSRLKSKSMVQFLKNTDSILAAAQLTYTYTKDISKADFLEWLPYYQSKMTEQGYRLLATPEWFDRKKAEGKEVESLFFYQHGQLVGSGIFTKDSAHDMAVFAFKANNKLELNSGGNDSLGALLDYLFLKLMVDQKVSHISAGRSRNAFGVFNTLGYLDYKLRFGYVPTSDPLSPNETLVPLDSEQGVVFWGVDQTTQQSGFYILKPGPNFPAFNFQRFNSPATPFITLESSL